MTFNEFMIWCNQRACDGCWSVGNVVACLDIISEVRRKPFWKRERYWKDHYEAVVIEQIVDPINQRIEEDKVYVSGK